MRTIELEYHLNSGVTLQLQCFLSTYKLIHAQESDTKRYLSTYKLIHAQESDTKRYLSTYQFIHGQESDTKRLLVKSSDRQANALICSSRSFLGHQVFSQPHFRKPSKTLINYHKNFPFGSCDKLIKKLIVKGNVN